MRTVVSLPRHGRAWVDLAASTGNLPEDLTGASLTTAGLGQPDSDGWEALIGAMIPRGGYELSGEIRVRNTGNGPDELAILAPDSVFLDGLGERFCGPRGTPPRKFGEAFVAGFMRRIGSGECVPGGRLVLIGAAPGLGSCTPWLLDGLGWMLADLWVHQEPADLRQWARMASAAAFERSGR